MLHNAGTILLTVALWIVAQCPMEILAVDFNYPIRNLSDYIMELKLVQFSSSGSGNYTHITTSPNSIYTVSNGDEVLLLQKDTLREISRFSLKGECLKEEVCKRININVVETHIEKTIFWYCFAQKVFAENSYRDGPPQCHLYSIDSSLKKLGQWPGQKFVSGDFDHNTITLRDSYNIYTGLNFFGDRKIHIIKHQLPFEDQGMVTVDLQLPVNYLKDPGEFLLSFKNRDSIYFLFLETDFLCGYYEKQIQTRLLRICRDDPGNDDQRFTAAAKVNVNCEQMSSSSDLPKYVYNVANAATWMPQTNQLIVSFISKNDKGYSASLCMYSIMAIEEAFNSDVKVATGRSSSGHHSVQNLCNDFSSKASNQGFLKDTYKLSEIYPLRKKTLSNVTFYQELDSKISFISYDESPSQHLNGLIILFLSLESRFHSAIALLSLDPIGCVLEKFWTNEKITSFKSDYNKKPLLYVGTSKRLFILPMDRCSTYQTEESCVSVLNPYCVWSTTPKICVFIKFDKDLKLLPRSAYKCPVKSRTTFDYALEAEIPCMMFATKDPMKQIGKCNCHIIKLNEQKSVISISDDCRVDGGWSSFSDWTDCSVTCGSGLQSRSRSCDNPSPQNGGRKCEGLMVENRRCLTTIECNKKEIQMENYSEWTSWSSCSKTCGFSTKQRRRYCAYGNCINSPTETQLCQSPLCEGTLMSEWSKWSKIYLSEIPRRRFRILCMQKYFHQPNLLAIQLRNVKRNLTQNCFKDECFQTNSVKILNGRWTLWSMWSPCSASCGLSFRTISRECSNGMCLGSSIDHAQCHVKPCQVTWGCWSDWFGCSSSCETPKMQTRSRHCLVDNSGKICDGPKKEEGDCPMAPCKFSYGPWSMWSSCQNDGIIIRRRKCKSNTKCLFPLLQSKPCMLPSSQMQISYSYMYMLVAGLVGVLVGVLVAALVCYVWWRCTISVIQKARSTSLKSSTANQLDDPYTSQSIHITPDNSSFNSRNRSSSYSEMYYKNRFVLPILHRSESYGFGLQPISGTHSNSYSTLKRALPEVKEV